MVIMVNQLKNKFVKSQDLEILRNF